MLFMKQEYCENIHNISLWKITLKGGRKLKSERIEPSESAWHGWACKKEWLEGSYKAGIIRTIKKWTIKIAMYIAKINKFKKT